MKGIHVSVCLSILSLFLGGQPVWAWEVYKYRMPDGSVAYTHEVSTTGKLEDVIGAPPPDSAEVEQALRLKLKREEGRVNRIAAKREANLTAVDAEIRSGTTALATAKQNLEAGLTPLPGEHLGIAAGHTRLSRPIGTACERCNLLSTTFANDWMTPTWRETRLNRLDGRRRVTVCHVVDFQANGTTRNPARGKCTTTSPARSSLRRMAICWADSDTMVPSTGILP